MARDEHCIGLFVEVESDRFVYLGLGRVIAVKWRLGAPELIGFQAEVPLERAWIERVAPELLRPQNE